LCASSRIYAFLHFTAVVFFPLPLASLALLPTRSIAVCVAPYKANQDEYTVYPPTKFGAGDKALFGVFDGHGHVGEKCARFAMSQLPPTLIAASDKFTAGGDAATKQALAKCFVDVNKKMHMASDIDDTLSGTTGVITMVVDNTLW
jgi:serine/threonine protein phosphatase PrpC